MLSEAEGGRLPPADAAPALGQPDAQPGPYGVLLGAKLLIQPRRPHLYLGSASIIAGSVWLRPTGSNQPKAPRGPDPLAPATPDSPHA